MSDVQRYPLAWPPAWKRTPAGGRSHARFGKIEKSYGNYTDGSRWVRTNNAALTVGDGLRRLNDELRRLGAQHVIISSNLRTNLDGSPSANQAKHLADPGIAVYFKLKGRDTVLACDRWLSAADNMAAIAGHIAALRATDRYGVGSVEQAFTGYQALPEATGTAWWTVLGVPVNATLDQAEDAYRTLARRAHPDVGGSNEEMLRLNDAIAAARKAGR